jgi:hypothetical protein
MLYAGGEVGINGDCLRAPAGCGRPLRSLADQRVLQPSTLETLPEAGHALLHGWYEAGWLHLAEDGTRE